LLRIPNKIEGSPLISGPLNFLMFSESYCNYQSEGRGTNLQFFGNWNFSIYQREEGRKGDTVGGEWLKRRGWRREIARGGGGEGVEKGGMEGRWRRLVPSVDEI
jgi:hypothetical protein